MLVVDDADILIRNRLDPVIKRISDSISKTQRIFFCNEITEKIDFLADKIMIEPVILESEE